MYRVKCYLFNRVFLCNYYYKNLLLNIIFVN